MNQPPSPTSLEERAQFWMELDASYAALQNDPQAWQEWQEEIAAWDVTLMDGLEDLVDDYSLEQFNVDSPEK